MQSTSNTDSDERQRLRRQFLRLRQTVTQENPLAEARLAAAVQWWLSSSSGRCAGVYSPFRGEPDVRPGVESAGLALAYPVVDDKAGGRMHYLRVTADTTFVAGAYGILEPQGGEVVVPDILFSPCVAVTPAGFRLGNGGGFFDRYLAKFAEAKVHPVTVAVAYDALVTEAFQPQAHDAAFDWIATESGVRRSGCL